MRVLRTTLATGAATALLFSAPLGAFAAERLHEDDGFTAFGSEGQLEIHLTEEHGYTDVTCVKETGFGADVLSYTIDPETYPNPIALRLQSNQGEDNQLWLDPMTDKAYEALGGAKFNFAIICTGTAPAEEPEEPGTPEEPGEPGTPEEPGEENPPIETDGPAQRPVDGLLIFGAAALVVGVGAVATGRRLNHRA